MTEVSVSAATHVCRLCGHPLRDRRPHALYCSGTCRALASRIQRVLSGQEDERYRSLADMLGRSNKRTQKLLGVSDGPVHGSQPNEAAASGELSLPSGTPQRVPNSVSELLVTEAALDKLGARGIAAHEAAQLPRNSYVLVDNPRAGEAADVRRLLIGRTDGGRALTLVLEQTIDPTTWLVVTGWDSSEVERRIIEG